MTPTLAFSTSDLKDIFLFVSASFLIAIFLAPLLTDFLFKNRIGKRLRQHDGTGRATPIFSALHKNKEGTPVMGGLLFWVTAAALTLIFNLDRAETWLPLFVLVAGGVIGGIDDIMNVLGKGDNGGGLRLIHKLAIFTVVAIVGAWWFHFKLGWDVVYIPIWGHSVYIDGWYIPLFIATVIFSSFSVNQTDGLDGLAGGVSMIAFFVFTLICLVQGKVHLAIFCASMMGALMAFLWFNINPARFFMGDTGSMALGLVLPVLAFLTNSVLLLPLILLIPFVEGVSTIIQLVSKRLFKRKVFLVAPIHHHFEALGWPESKVTMRFWLIAAVGASFGLVLMLATRPPL